MKQTETISCSDNRNYQGISTAFKEISYPKIKHHYIDICRIKTFGITDDYSKFSVSACESKGNKRNLSTIFLGNEVTIIELYGYVAKTRIIIEDFVDGNKFFRNETPPTIE